MVLASTPKPRAPAHHKKRHGGHHKTSKQYVKTYWPYLPMLLLVLTGFLFNTLWEAHSHVLGQTSVITQQSLLEETNLDRLQHGRIALSLNSDLNKAAQEKASDMAIRDYWSHTTPEGQQPWQFIQAAGYRYTAAGENLAYGFDSGAEAVAGWMRSSGHRDNLLNAGYKEVGFGIAESAHFQNEGRQTVVVAMYATPDTDTISLMPPTEVAMPHVLSSHTVSRADILAAGNVNVSGIGIALSVLITIGAISFVYRHGRLWRRFLVRGEHFIIQHPLLDIVLVGVVVTAFVLTRTSGVIH